MKIYRIEDSNGYGIFRGPNNVNSELIDETEAFASEQGTTYSQLHPLPLYDDKLVIQAKNKGLKLYGPATYGFSSKAQIKMWFPTERIKSILKDNGFKVSVYEVSAKHFAKGDTQAIFYRNHATLIKRIEIDEI